MRRKVSRLQARKEQFLRFLRRRPGLKSSLTNQKNYGILEAYEESSQKGDKSSEKGAKWRAICFERNRREERWKSQAGVP